MNIFSKLSITSIFLIYSFNGFAASKVLASVNGSDITQAAVENFIQHIKRPISIKDALLEMITIEAIVSHRLKTPITNDSTLQLELERNRKGIIAANTLETILADFSLSEDELKAEYQKQYLSDVATQEYNAKHILVKNKDEALNIIRQLNNDANFESLAKQHSTGSSGKLGGDLGWFTFGKMVKPFSEATAALKKDQHSQTPVKTQFGWHIIKLYDMRKKTPLTLKEVAANIKSRHSALMLSAEIQKLHKAANIVINKP